MLRGLYAAASGLEANLINQDAITENLAHANVPGFKRQGAVFETFEPILAGATAATPGVSIVAQTLRQFIVGLASCDRHGIAFRHVPHSLPM